MNNKNELIAVGLFTGAFLLGGLIHVVAGPMDFTSCIAQIYYSALVLIWAVTVSYRIVNKRVRRLMLAGVGLFMLALFLQMCRYRVFEAFTTLCRWLWYGYYIPIVLVPVLFLFVVLHLHLQEDERPDRRWLLMLIPASLLILLVLTNDLHQLVFRFPGDPEGITGQNGTYTHRLPFYLFYVWFLAVLTLGVALAIKQCRLPNIVKKLWMPLYFAGFGILVVLSLFDSLTIQGVSLWLLVECLAMVVIGIEESCIQLGLIPANSSYQTVARLADKPFIISDREGRPVYASRTAQEMFRRKQNLQIYEKPIKGGRVSWAVDLTGLNELNRQLETANQSIQSRNEYLQTQNALKEEETRLATKNALYNQIAGSVRSQLDVIEVLQQGTADNSTLAKIAVLSAYIKRRSNMELLKADRESFPAEELASAIRESCEYLKLCGVNAVLNHVLDCQLEADTQIILYQSFEAVVEGCMDSLQLLLVNVTLENSRPMLRMTLSATSSHIGERMGGLLPRSVAVSLYREGDEGDLTITITRKEGGGVQ